ncbi:glycosyltransferase [Kluyvera sp. NPDC087067]|uniref:glycosyltransferase n=1 Tax=Kluyvera sp. NPDC087067 TaxID=3364105 RepID=UPI003815A356
MIPDLVSVYIPTHNRKDLLSRAIHSVLKQTYKSIEIIVSDDGSRDGTSELIEELQSKFQNIIYVKSDIAQGACFARNKAINLANGEYITGLDDDDEFTEDRIEKMVNTLKNNLTISFVCTGIQIVNSHGTGKGYTQPRLIRLPDLLNENIIGNQILTKTALLKQIHGFDETLPAWQDYECWIRFCDAHGQGYNTGELTYIMHLEHDLPRISGSKKVKTAMEIILEKHKTLLNNKNKSNIYINYCYHYDREISLKQLLNHLTIINIKRYLKLKIRKILNLR